MYIIVVAIMVHPAFTTCQTRPDRTRRDRTRCSARSRDAVIVCKVRCCLSWGDGPIYMYSNILCMYVYIYIHIHIHVWPSHRAWKSGTASHPLRCGRSHHLRNCVMYIYIYIYTHTHTCDTYTTIHTCVCIYIYIYTICMFTPFGIVSKFKGNNLSNTTCLTQAFFKSGEECSEFW